MSWTDVSQGKEHAPSPLDSGASGEFPLVGGLSNQVIGPYSIGASLGRGAMGEVYAAERKGPEGFCRSVAIKRMRVSLNRDSRAVTRFFAEARTQALLGHPNVVQVLDLLTEPEPLLVLERIDGPDLAQVMRRARKRNAAIPVPVALYLVAELADALAHAHGLDVVHRDVSPQNVLLSRSGDLKLGDFGLAIPPAVDEPALCSGKLGYAAPELLLFDEVDARGDLYALGVIFWELLAGRPFMANGEVGATLQRLARGQIPPLSTIRSGIGDAVEVLVIDAMRVSPALRIGSASEFGRRARGLLHHRAPGFGAEDLVRELGPDLGGAR